MGFIKKERKGKSQEDNVSLQVEAFLENHPYKNVIIRNLGPLENDETFLILLSLLAHGFDEYKNLFISMDKKHVAAYEDINKGFKKMFDRLEYQSDMCKEELKRANSRMLKLNENIMSNHRLVLKIHEQLNRKTWLQRLWNWLNS